MSPTAARRDTDRSSVDLRGGRPAEPGPLGDWSGRSSDSWQVPSLSGELRASALLLAFALAVTAGVAAAARLLAGPLS